MYKTGYKIRHKKFNTDGINKAVKEELAREVREALGPALVDQIMIQFDKMTEDIGMVADPTSPQHWRDEFEAHLRQTLYDTILVTEKGVKFAMGDKTFLGYNEDLDPDDATPLRWAVYWFEGLAGRYAFVPAAMVEQVRGQRAVDESQMGRFGEGYMLSKKAYEASGFDQVAPFSSMEHPLSNSSPIDLFKDAMSGFDMEPYIRRAVKRALERSK